MAYAFVQQVDNGLAANANAAAVTITSTAHNTVIVISSQHPTSTATITDTLGETWIAIPQSNNGIFGDGLFAYVCQNSIGGANTITVHSNSTNVSGVVAYEYSGLSTTIGILGSAVLGQNGPGAGTDAISAGGLGTISVLPAMIFGIACDFQGTGNVPSAGTGYTARASIWSGNTGGAHALAEDKRITVSANPAATFTATTGSGDIYISYGIVLAESGAVGPSITAWWKA